MSQEDRGRDRGGAAQGRGHVEGPARDGGADVIVPVHNSPADVRDCLHSVLATLGPEDRLIVIDDGSAAETRDICAEAVERGGERARLIRRETGSGFCRAANAGIRASDRPVVILLNSDTIVPPGWIERIRACMSANPDIGIAGPLSNSGSWQSIPSLGTGGPPINQIRSDPETLAAIQAFCADQKLDFEYPIIEQVNGFCLAVTREVFDAVGLLDEEAFPMGYGEEVDLNIRAQDAGFLCAVAIDCFVYHAKTKSYTPEMRKAHVQDGVALNERRHGADRIRSAKTNSRSHPTLEAIRERAAVTFRDAGWMLEH